MAAMGGRECFIAECRIARGERVVDYFSVWQCVQCNLQVVAVRDGGYELRRRARSCCRA